MTFLTLFCVASFLSSAIGETSDAPTRQEVISALVQAEGLIADASVQLSMSQFELAADSGLAPSPFARQINWAWRVPFGSVMYLEEEGSAPWISGVQPVSYSHFRLAFDGTLGTDLTCAWIDPQRRDEAQPTGRITTTRHPALTSLVEGFQYATFWRYEKPLSEVVIEEPRTSFSWVRVPGVEYLVCKVVVPNDGTKRPNAGVNAFFLDLNRGCAIVQWQEFGTHDTSRLDIEVRDVVLRERQPGIWWPTQLKLYDYTSAPVAVKVFTVTNALFNSGLKDVDFVVDFPAGTTVTDKRSDVTYEVGFRVDELEPILEQEAQAVRTAVKQVAHGEPVALNTAPAPRPSDQDASPRYSRLPFVLWLSVLGALATSLWAVGRTSWIRSATVRISVILLLTGVALLGVTVIHANYGGTAWGAGTLEASSIGLIGVGKPAPLPVGSRPVNDCGKNLLAFLAKYYECGFGAAEVASLCTWNAGASLLELQQVAEQMGLRSQGVQLANAAELRRLIDEHPNSSVIVSTTVGRKQRGHFFLVVGTANNQFMIIDPPRRLHLADPSGIDEALRRAKGFGLLLHGKPKL